MNANAEKSRFVEDSIVSSEKWHDSCVHTECTFHQLSPYIGKVKSSIAKHLILKYTNIGDLVVDPFCGSGTIPLEAVINGRKTFAADISPYAFTLTMGKLTAPKSVDQALLLAKDALTKSRIGRNINIDKLPEWVQSFFHPNTLREALKFSNYCKKNSYYFLQACLLGILHHQRPGFLSYPSSHLVPYLRDRKYPRSEFPDMYEYRPLEPRIIAKIKRSYKRSPKVILKRKFKVVRGDIEGVVFPRRFDCLLTSPPYMNTLDYERDNRLRLWFLKRNKLDKNYKEHTDSIDAFNDSIKKLAYLVETSLRPGGRAILIVGQKANRTFGGHPSDIVRELLAKYSPSVRLQEVIQDHIPDIRRSIRSHNGVKIEHILVYGKI